MLRAIGVPSLDALIDQTIPSGIRFSKGLEPAAGRDRGRVPAPPAHRRGEEPACRGPASAWATTTRITPAVILRNVFENPGWYTPYTPYQAEIAQGRLESLLNFQTMVRDLTGMEIASASLLDEGTAAAEAMTMFHRLNTKKAPAGQESGVPRVGADVPADHRRPAGARRAARHQARDRRSRRAADGSARSACCCSIRTITARSRDLRPIIEKAHAAGLLVAVASDLMALTLLTPPGEMGADAVVGNSQRFGVPLGYGGPHAAFFATRESFVRQAPGRIIGVSVDARGHRAYRMALQTREQHIRREKATSNICTAQALLANIAAMYAVFHGPKGLRAIGERIHGMARAVEDALAAAGPASRPTPPTSTRCASRGRTPPPSARPRSPPASTSATSRTARSASRSTRRRPSRTSPTSSRPSRAGSKPVYKDGAPFDDEGADPTCAGTSEYLHAPGVQHASLRDRDDALHPQPRAEGRRPRHVDDPARLLHDEAERGGGDAAGDLAGVQPDASVRAGRPGAGLRRGLPAISRRRCARSPGLPACRCSRTPARRASSPG